MEKSSATTAEADAAGNGNGKKGGLRLYQDYVDLISSWEPESFEDPDEHYARLMSKPACYSQDHAERSRKLQQELVAMQKFYAVRIEKFHAWVRAEVEEKGYAEVDEFIPDDEDEDFAQFFGPTDGAVSEEDDDDAVFALAFGPMPGVVAEGDDDEFALAAAKEE